MVYSTISRLESEYVESDAFLNYKKSLLNNNFTLLNESTSLNSDHDDHIMNFRIRVSTSLAFWCGTVQVSHSSY